MSSLSAKCGPFEVSNSVGSRLAPPIDSDEQTQTVPFPSLHRSSRSSGSGLVLDNASRSVGAPPPPLQQGGFFSTPGNGQQTLPDLRRRIAGMSVGWVDPGAARAQNESTKALSEDDDLAHLLSQGR